LGEGTFNLHPNGKAPAATINKTSDEILDEVKAMTREWETILDVIPSGKAVFRIANLPEDNTGPITIPNVGWRVTEQTRRPAYCAGNRRDPAHSFAYIAKVVFSLYQAVSPTGWINHKTSCRYRAACVTESCSEHFDRSDRPDGPTSIARSD